MGDLLKGRVAVVTGAGNGIGRAEAKGLAAQGASVVVNDLGVDYMGNGISSEPADKVVEDIKAAGGIAVANYSSVADEEGAKSIIQTAIDSFGRIDVLINNAGYVRTAPVHKIPTEDWDGVLKTHLYGTFYCTRAATAIMKEQGYGRIVNTASHIGLGFRGQATYSTAKEAIVGFTRTVARDMQDYGTCNAIRPIAAWRGAGQQPPQGAANNPAEKINTGLEVNQPEDIAALVVYLASEKADNINGCIFEVWRGHVGIFKDPPPVDQVLWKDGRWTPEELAETMPQTITKEKTRSLISTFPFMNG
ncbi:MAG: SDR family oxidoreductase [Dehalococcoidales bacterium]|nr:SDR family oxidoreductase [Dehalococcoidales bacterium]